MITDATAVAYSDDVLFPPPALVERLRQNQQQHRLFPTGSQPLVVVVGVSGGADSVCLLHLLLQLAPEWQIDLHVAHLNHSLRPDAAADAAFVAELAQRHSLPFHGQTLPRGALAYQPGGLEHAARQARYAFLHQVALNVTPVGQVPILTVAHHADDQAETVLLHLIRGSGLDGLTGMRWVTEQRRIEIEGASAAAEAPERPLCIVRPLLNVRKAELRDYLAGYGLSWCEDETNWDFARVRNRLRWRIVPLLEEINPGVVAALGRTAAVLAGEADRLAHLDRAALAALAHGGEMAWLAAGDRASESDRIVLNLEELQKLDAPTQRGVLRRALALLAPELRDLGFAHVENLVEKLREPRPAGGPYTLLADLAWTVAPATPTEPARLSLHRADAPPFAPDAPHLPSAWQPTPVARNGSMTISSGWTLHSAEVGIEQLPADWRSQAGPWQAFLDAERMGLPTLAVPAPGLRVAPLGLGGHHKTLGDLFTDHKTPTALRAGWPLLVDGQTGAVLWVCGLVVAHPARITEQTRRVLWLRWWKNGPSSSELYTP